VAGHSHKGASSALKGVSGWFACTQFGSYSGIRIISSALFGGGSCCILFARGERSWQCWPSWLSWRRSWREVAS